MTPHKHAEVLRQIADGVSIDEFEIGWIHGTEEDAGFKNATFRDLIYAIQFPEHWEIRRKPKHIIVNGFKVPTPLEEDPGILVWVPNLMSDTLVVSRQNPRNRLLAVERRIAHSAREAAIAHAKAMLGLDPQWEI